MPACFAIYLLESLSDSSVRTGRLLALQAIRSFPHVEHWTALDFQSGKVQPRVLTLSFGMERGHTNVYNMHTTDSGIGALTWCAVNTAAAVFPMVRKFKKRRLVPVARPPATFQRMASRFISARVAHAARAASGPC